MRAELGLVGKWELEKAERWNLKEPGGRRWRGCAAVLEGPEVQVKDAGGGLSRLERLPNSGTWRVERP